MVFSHIYGSTLFLTICIGVLSQNTTAPTFNPTFGPVSDDVVTAIFFDTLAGIVGVLIIYFYTGHYLYQNDVDARLKKHDDREIMGETEDNSYSRKFSNELSPLIDEDGRII